VASGKENTILELYQQSPDTPPSSFGAEHKKVRLLKKKRAVFADQREAEFWAKRSFAGVRCRPQNGDPKNRAANRAVRRRNGRAIDEWLKSLSYVELAEIITQKHEHAAAALQKIENRTRNPYGKRLRFGS